MRLYVYYQPANLEDYITNYALFYSNIFYSVLLRYNGFADYRQILGILSKYQI